MNCYDCAQSGHTKPALAICHDCGAGLCADHGTEAQHTSTMVRPTNTQHPVDPPQRRIRYHRCAAAITRADELSATRMSHPSGPKVTGRSR